MASLGVSAENNAKRETFFKMVFGPTVKGFACLAFAQRGRSGMVQEFYKWPEELPSMLESINTRLGPYEVYYSPMLYTEKTRHKDTVAPCMAAWADLDECPPSRLKVKPTITIESSEGRYQGVWCFEDPQEPEKAEEISQRIAYGHRGDGADLGWFLTKLLRVPFTYNHKYDPPETVTIVEANRNRYRLDDFNMYEDVPEMRGINIPLPAQGDLPELPPEDLLHERRHNVVPKVWILYNTTPNGKSWSEPFWELQLLLFEAGFSREEVFVIAKGAKCNKFARDNRPDEFLWKEVCRAFAQAEYNASVIVPRDSVVRELDFITDEERRQIERSPSLVERYINWASSLGDAAQQYHQAGAFVILSSLVSGNLKLPTSYGTLVPNLWFMILADTTLTRKTTAMDIAMELLIEIDPDIVLATDGSIEGLMTSLSMRPGRPSVFLRDEFSGLLEMMTKRDYYAGMAETLTKLYDGKMQKRILRKEVIEVKDPRLIVFAGGIRSRVTGLLTVEHVASGFIPRFIFITAESQVAKMRPLGPPSTANIAERQLLLEELERIHEHYATMQVVNIAATNTKIERPLIREASLTQEAWARFNKLEADLMQAGLDAERPEIMTPTYDRLSKSTLKAAVLIAATRCQDHVEVTEEDLCRAMYYSEEWRNYGHTIINEVGKSVLEHELDKVFRNIQRHDGISRSQLMQNHHLTSRNADLYFQTLEQRGMIAPQRMGKGMRYFVTPYGKEQ